MSYQKGQEVLRCQPFTYVIYSNYREIVCDFCLKYSKNIVVLQNTEGPRLTRKTGPGKTPRYAKSRCARLLLCSKCPTESPKPRETEDSVLGEVTTV